MFLLIELSLKALLDTRQNEPFLLLSSPKSYFKTGVYSNILSPVE